MNVYEPSVPKPPDTNVWAAQCPTASGMQSTMDTRARELLGQTRTHLYVGSGGIFAWPKSGGVAKRLPELLPIAPGQGYSQKVVSEEMIFWLAAGGDTAQVMKLDGEPFLLPPPEGSKFTFVDAAPAGAMYVATSRLDGSAGAIYRVRAETRSIELVHVYDGAASWLQAEDGALYWLRGSLAESEQWGDLEVIEYVLDPGEERVLSPAARRRELLYVSGDKLVVAVDVPTESAPTLEQRDRRTGDVVKTFPRVDYFSPGQNSFAARGERLLFSKKEDQQYGPMCPPPGQLFELTEDGEMGRGYRTVPGIAASTFLVDETFLFYTYAQNGCSIQGRPMGSRIDELICYRQ